MLGSPAGVAVTRAGPGGIAGLTDAIGAPPEDLALAAALESPVPQWLQDPGAPDRSVERRAQLKLKGVLDALTLLRDRITTEAMLELLKATSEQIAAEFADADTGQGRLRLLVRELPMLLLHHTVLDGDDWARDRALVTGYASWTCTAYARAIGLPPAADLQVCSLMDPAEFERSGTFRALQQLKRDLYDPAVAPLTHAYRQGKRMIEQLFTPTPGDHTLPRRRARVLGHQGKGAGGGPTTHTTRGYRLTKTGRILGRVRETSVVPAADPEPRAPLLLEGPPAAPPAVPATPWLDLTLQILDALPYILALALAQPEKAMALDLADIPHKYRRTAATITPFDELTIDELRHLARLNDVDVADWHRNPLPPERVYAELVDKLASDAIKRNRITLEPDPDHLYRRCRSVHRRYKAECQAYAFEHAERSATSAAAPAANRRRGPSRKRNQQED